MTKNNSVNEDVLDLMLDGFKNRHGDVYESYMSLTQPDVTGAQIFCLAKTFDGNVAKVKDNHLTQDDISVLEFMKDSIEETQSAAGIAL
ncbi:MAG: hypothetical protein COA45_01405 [Zetaproteobacteria bacterium]|nr:MAG: hypothetical protein COA45_01405 [Zetaproteobacteria bacterium]